MRSTAAGSYSLCVGRGKSNFFGKLILTFPLREYYFHTRHGDDLKINLAKKNF